MNNLLHAGTAVLNQTPLDWDGNASRIRTAIAEARERGVTLLCLPELCITGYGCEDAFLAPGVQRMALDSLRELVPETKGMVVSFGLPVLYQHAIFNVAALAVDGELIGFAAKQNLAGDGIHYEPRWYRAWPKNVTRLFEFDDDFYPIGDVLFEIGGVRIGFEICEDAWVADRPGARLALRGVDVVMNPSASHFAFDKHTVRERFVIEGSRSFHATYLYANLLGNEAGRAIYDGDTLIATDGKVLARGARFSFNEVQLISAIVDLDITRMKQSRSASYEPDLSDEAEDAVTEVPFDWPDVDHASVDDAKLPDWEFSEHLKEEEFTRAVALGLFDYCRKSRSKGFVVSLSGGADSAACAVLVEVMRQLAGERISLLGAETTADLLTCAYQATRNSGDVTRTAATEVAKAIGATFYEFDIDTIVENYKSVVEGGIGRELTWEQDDITLQNIQARVRAPSVWMLANIKNALLLSTSNRSEAAVGYATMDGDTSGGLSPIAGIDKAFLREWLRWMDTTGPEGVGPIPALKHVNDQQPTAELRPPESKQTDEDDLMPYPVLDAIERLAIRDKKSPLNCYRLLKRQFPEADAKQVHTWVVRFFQLWSRNQWKRERYAPSFHLDDANLDPKTWCRWPILSGGFERELRELEEFVAKEL
ncbi:MAG: NAD(+) synthase [Verrucomicrobiota bacterium]